MLFICCRTFAKFTKRFKGCHCPLRHVGTPLKTTTDCHSSTTKAFDLEFVVTTPGYWRVFGNASHGGTASVTALDLFDGTTSKGLVNFVGTGTASSTLFDFIVKLEAGDSVRASTNVGANFISGSTRQIADITGTLVNP